MTLGIAYSASLGKFLPGAGPGGEAVNIAPLQYLALKSLLTTTATPTTIAQAQAIIPGVCRGSDEPGGLCLRPPPAGHARHVVLGDQREQLDGVHA
jgi:hypothetical protein